MDAALVLWLQSDLYYKAVVSSASWGCVRGFMLLLGVKELDLQAAVSRHKKVTLLGYLKSSVPK